MKINIRLHPKSSRRKAVYKNKVFEIYVHSPPEKNKANKELIEHTAKALSLTKSSVKLINGAKSRNKILELENMRLEENEIQKLMEKNFR